MYIVAHWFGWWLKMMILRDVVICTFLSVTFEGLELTFKHWLPNFAECWWDSLILDIILCNMIGIFLGYLTCKYLEMRTYKWFGKKSKRGGCTDFVQKFFELFQPNVWVNFNWHMFSSLGNFLGVSWIICINNINDLNNFFLKFVLWIPSNHWTLLIRAFLLSFLGMIFYKGIL